MAELQPLIHLLSCPTCHGFLNWCKVAATCQYCVRTFPVVDGIPVFLPQPVNLGHAPRAEEHRHKAQQAAFYDEEDPEFEIMRPHGTPRIYHWLLAEKSRRSLAGLCRVPKSTVLTVCGGSGMDADFLAHALPGTHFIASDISLGAAQRTAERARRFGLAIFSIVADVEHLPFADHAIDLVYVHDGLHHLEDPGTGLSEMARVAARAVSVTEPCAASATRLAVRLHIAQDTEDAGNRVARLESSRVIHDLSQAGFDGFYVDRYAMYYKHHPGAVMRVLSNPGLFVISRFAWHIANALVVRFGNKITVQAYRVQE